jgi:hypothetical protein
MKLSPTFLASLSVLAAACGTSGSSDLPAPAPADTGTATQPAPVPQKRTLVTGAQMPTTAVNLLLDPGFGLVDAQPGYGMFLAFLESDYSQVTLSATLDSRSPAGYGGGVGLVKPDGATNKSSGAVLLLASFQGGDGPFHGRVWVSKSDVSGKPVDFGTDAKSIRVSLTDASPDGDAFDMKPTDGATTTIGGRTWVMLEVDVPKTLPYGGYFVAHTGGGGGQWHLAAPEVVAKPLADALTTRALVTPAVGRSTTFAERKVTRKYRSLEPKLVPASMHLSPR